jgi:hypothetical protein
MFAFDCRDRSEAPADTEPACVGCGRPIAGGIQCATCWVLEEGAGYEDRGGEA